jgi:RND family efflux transporter MFP subunit
LWEQNIGSEIDFLQAKTQLEALNRSLQTLEEQMEMAVMRAPFAGVVDRCLAKTGEFAVPGAPLVRIVDLREMYVRASVSDHYAGKVNKGMSAEVIVSGVDTILTNVGRVGQFINPSNRTLEISLPLPQGSKFLPNMYASVWLQDLGLDSAVVLPSALVQQDINGDEFVYVADGEGATRTVRKKLITSGMGSGDNLLIASGLVFGDDVISRGANRVSQGQKVNLITD